MSNEVNLRPAVGRFAVAMELTLRKNDERKGATGWKGRSIKHLETRIDVNLAELKESIKSDNSEGIKDRCIDIGNLVMMRWDNEITNKMLTEEKESYSNDTP